MGEQTPKSEIEETEEADAAGGSAAEQAKEREGEMEESGEENSA